MYIKSILIKLLLALSIIFSSSKLLLADEFSHGISVFGDLKYPKNFKNFDYVDPKAKKAGELKLGVEGGFNSLNQFILKGLPASGLSYLYDSLCEGSDDEISTRYGLIAQGVHLSADKMTLNFLLRKNARFHDGKNITADDVVFTFNKLILDGHPSYKMMYRDVKNVKKINDYLVRFEFKNNRNRDLPILLSSMIVLPKHYYNKIDFNKTTLDFPLGSGPYKIKEITPNRTIVYERVRDYWAKDLAVNKGRYNFDKIIFDYYRDNNVLIEAFKAQKYDLRLENVARNWANSYNIEAIKNQQIIKKEIKHSLPAPAQVFVLNLRKEKFNNIALRKALTYAFDFEWLQKNIFYGSYVRTQSYFANSEFAYDGFKMPVSSDERKNNNGFNRKNLILAQKILLEAGYKIIDNKLYEPNSNKQLTLEFLIDQKAFEMIVMHYVKNLKKLGINAKVLFVEENQYQTRINNFDFEIITALYSQSLIPGSELYSYFHSSQKDIKGSRNLGGIADQKIDKIILKILDAKSKEMLKNESQKLDQYLLENYYAIMQWHNNSYRILYRDIFAMPEIQPKYALAIDSWSLK
jgi:microcin C transport system substrate-binding protein